MTNRTNKTLNHNNNKKHSSDIPSFPRNRIKVDSDSIVTTSPRQVSDCSAIVNNGVKTRQFQLYQNACYAIMMF